LETSSVGIHYEIILNWRACVAQEAAPEGQGFSSAVKPRRRGALAPEAAPFDCGNLSMTQLLDDYASPSRASM
jgi:hypothetical protein